MDEKIVLCGANSYQQKYYFNPQFKALPENIRQELQIMCVLFTEDVGGILTLEFDKDGNLEFQVSAEEGDWSYSTGWCSWEKVLRIRNEAKDWKC